MIWKFSFDEFFVGESREKEKMPENEKICNFFSLDQDSTLKLENLSMNV